MTERGHIQHILTETAPYVAERYHGRATLQVSTKSGHNDLLTEVDLEVQRRITQAIQDTFPNDTIIGEELGQHAYPADPNVRCWIIDPIDGTQNFIRGLFPAFGVSIAFSNEGAVQAGGVAIPLTGDILLAARGQGATRNGQPLRVSTIPAIDRARVEIDFGSPQSREGSLTQFPRVIRKAGQLRCHCAAVIGICNVALDHADAYFHVGLNPWDYAAAVLIAEEAGGKASRLNGTPIHLFDSNTGVLVTNGALHEEALALITQNG